MVRIRLGGTAAAIALGCALIAASGCGERDGRPLRGGAEGTVPSHAGAEESGAEARLSTIEIAEQLAPSIVRVQTEGAMIDAFGRVVPGGGVGSGVIIDEEGHIVTNNHVVVVGDEPASSITVTLSDGRALAATVIGRDEATDLAVLRVEADQLMPATFADPSTLLVGQDVVAIGFALGLEGGPTVTRGVLSARGRTIDEGQYTIPDAIQTDAGINPGNSGGPLVNAAGEIVGINTAIVSGAENIGFAISVSLAEPVVDELIRRGRVERAYLGIATVEVTPVIADSFNLPVEYGVAVTGVGDGTPAEAGGLREDDIIVGLGGREVRHSGDLLAALAEHPPGDTVEVEVYRDNERQAVEVTLGEPP